MALEPAGISLEAQNFNKYIKQLDRIDKAQQDIFDVDDKELASAFEKATKAAKNYEKELNDIAKSSKKAETSAKGVGVAAAGAAGVGIAAVSALTDAFVNLASTAANAFIEITKGGVKLNQQFELTEKVFTNVFGDPQLGKATVDFLIETSNRLRIAQKDAAGFAQVILPKTGGLDEFTELLRLTDIQADSTGKTFDELTFSIQNALAGQFESLKEQFDIDPTQIKRIQELTPSMGRAAAIAKVLGDEFARLGKTDISGTLAVNIKDINTRFTTLQATLGKPTFDQLRIQSENLLSALDRNEEGLQRSAIALGEVTANVVELVGTELVAFIDSLDFKAIETGVSNLNAFVEALRVVSIAVKEAFQTGVIQASFGFLTGNVDQLFKGLGKIKEADFGQSFQNIANATTAASERQADYKKRVDEAANTQSSFNSENEKAINDFLAQSSAADQARQSIQSYTNTLKQAEQLQISFARAAENSALKLARANEDITRKQQKDVADLGQKQKKDRDKLLDDQIKQLDKFDADRRKQITKAESDFEKERKKVREQRKKDEQKLQRDLQRAEDRFNLSRLQSERRFSLSERRLRAEGDILALQQLREDQELARQEEKENFDLSQKQQEKSGLDQIREQEKVSNERIKELKSDLEAQRGELLKSFDEQIEVQKQAQIKAQQLQEQQFAEQAIERQIQLQREEEDRRISQGRQLEDLGRSLAEQEGVTAEGSAAIANELEKVFGIGGIADNVMTGFTAKTENEFTELFENLEKTVSETDLKKLLQEQQEAALPGTLRRPSGGTLGTVSRIGGVQRFQEGGIVAGPIGSPQPAIVHAGETVLPTHRQSFTMVAPVIPSQSLDVNMSGGFNVTGDGQSNDAILQAAAEEMTENFRIAVKRLARRN
jgi:hypothetical protein